MKLCIKKEILIGVLIILAIFVMAVVIHAGGTEKKEDTDYAGIQDVRDGYKYTSHEPIYINGNDDFVVGENGVVSGNGTEDDAYIIEGWDIDASTTNGIDIENTDVYFIIGNCTIHNGKYNSKNGIYFYNVTNSKIDNVFSYTNYYGVRLDYSSNNSITDCTIYNNCDGIHPYYSSNNVVNACNIYDNGYSINLEYSSNNSIANCSVYNNYYGSIYLGLSSNNNRITNCTVYNNSGYGIFLHYSSDNNISTCNIYKNWYGIQLSGSSNNQILNCTLYNNSWHGINLGYSSNNEIHYSNIYDNTGYGVDNDNSELEYQTNATYNWWGSANGPGGVGPGSGDKVTSNVLYDPWFTSADKTYLYHAPIYINNNSGFNATNGVSAGDGSASNPYIIENWDIDASSTHGIYISETDVYFIIRNCIIHDGSSSYHGVYFYSASNGKIDSVISYNNFKGILLYDSSNNNISRNQIYNNCDGISFEHSSDNIVSDCIIFNNYDGIFLSLSSNNMFSSCQIYNKDNGFWLSQSSNNTLRGCIICNNSYVGIELHTSPYNNLSTCQIYNNPGCGIYIYSSPNTILRNNFLENNTYNFNVKGEDISHYYQDIDTSNKINGKPIYYVIDQSDLVFNETMSMGYLGLVSCNNIFVKNLDIKDNGEGLLLVNTTHSKIVASQIHNNFVGIHLIFSSNNTFSNCQVSGCYGICFSYSSKNTVDGCVVSASWYGIELERSSNNKIHFSNIYDNTNYGIYNYDLGPEYVTDATNNWWGAADGPSGIGTGSGDAVGSNVLYDPWLVEYLEDLTLPTIIQTTPSDEEINVPVNTTVTITFSEPMNILTIPGNITIEPNIDIDYIWSNNKETLSIVPNVNLSYNTTYIFAVSTNVEDDAKATDSNGVTHSVGNRLLYSYQFSFTIEKDVTPPVIIIISPADNTITNQNITLIYSVSDNFDDIRNITIIGPDNNAVYSDEKSYTIIVNASDRAGNTASKTILFIIDKTSPTITISSPEDGLITNQNVTLSYSFSDNVSSVENITVSGDESPYTEGGDYSIVLTATDQAGNTAQDIVTFTIDKTKPIITISGVEDGAYYNTDVAPVVDIIEDNLNITSITLNDNPFTNGTTISVGDTYVLVVQTNDKAGNSANKTITFTIDKTPPTVTIAESSQTTNKNSFTMSWSASENIQYYEISTDGVNWVNVSTDTQHTFAISKGDNALYVRGTDKAGNTGTADITVTYQEKKQGKPGIIPGFEFFFLLGGISIAMLIWRKYRKHDAE